MAFDAGAIEATLTLNRNPFSAGLAAAKSQAAEFKKRVSPIEVDIKVNLREAELKAIEARLKKFGSTVAKATAEIVVKGRVAFDKLLADLKRFDGKTYSANVDVDTGRATAQVIAFRTLLASLNDQTVQLSANTRAFGKSAGAGFDEGSSHFQKLAVAVIAGLPIIASAFTATVGAVGALSSAMLIAGLGAGAFALVAVPAFKKVKEAVAAGQAEINKLPPGLKEAANGLKELLAEYTKLQTATQKIVGIALSAWFNAGTAALKTLAPLVTAAANAFGDAGIMAIKFFSSPWWQQFVGFLSGAIGPAVDKLFRGIFALIQIVGNLTRAFWDLGGSQIMEMITKGLEDFAKWTEKIGQNKTFQEFMEAAKRSLPAVGALIGDLLVFIFRLAVGLEPLGTLIIRVLTGIFDAVNKIPPELLGALALGFAAVWAAMALGASGPVGIAVGVLTGLAVILSDLYTKNEAFRTTINGLVEDLKAKWQPIWDVIVKNFNDKILPAWESLRSAIADKLIPALQRFGAVFMEEVWPKIQPFVDEITGTLAPAILRFLEALVGIISFLVDVFGPTIARELGSAVTVFQGAFDMIAGALDIFTGIFTADWTTFTQGITEITRGFWTIIAGMFGTNLEGLKATLQQWDREIDAMWRAFWDGLTGWFKGLWEGVQLWWRGFLDILAGDTSQGADKIGQAWRKIANLFRDPINWVINTVINDGIIGAWNQVMGWIGVGGIAGRVPGLPAFARGGPVSGGIPGKDSVPILAQQGEYVLSRPAVNAMGGISSVDRMHTAARGGSPGGATFERGGPVGIGRYAVGGPVTTTATTVSMWSLFGSQVESLFRGLGFGHAPMGGMIGDAISQIPGALVNKVLTAAQAKLSSIFQTIITTVFGGGGGNVAGVGAVGGGGARAWIIARESGGNPRAQNPTSSASGLYQMIDGTWRAYGGSTAHAKDASVAEQNAVADRYVASRYGSWEGAQAFWQSHGYYDQGGILPTGTTLTTNNTGHPEAILTQAQLRTLTSPRSQGLSMADVVALLDSRVGGGGGDVYNVMLPERASVRELADSLDFKRRVMSKGRYSR